VATLLKFVQLIKSCVDDKPIHYTLKSDKSEERAELLVTMAKGMVEKMGFKQIFR
jgi:hypothetical protein